MSAMFEARACCVGSKDQLCGPVEWSSLLDWIERVTRENGVYWVMLWPSGASESVGLGADALETMERRKNEEAIR